MQTFQFSRKEKVIFPNSFYIIISLEQCLSNVLIAVPSKSCIIHCNLVHTHICTLLGNKVFVIYLPSYSLFCFNPSFNADHYILNWHHDPSNVSNHICKTLQYSFPFPMKAFKICQLVSTILCSIYWLKCEYSVNKYLVFHRSTILLVSNHLNLR